KRFPHAITGGYSFRPYNYGPFDSEVYADGEKLEGQQLVSISRPTGRWKTYAATPAGVEKAQQLEKQADPDAAAYVRRVVTWARSLSFRDLVQSVYNAFPEMKTNSLFKDEQ